MRRAGYVGYPNQGAVARGGASVGHGVASGGPLMYSFTAFTAIVNDTAEIVLATMPQIGVLAAPRALCRVTFSATYSVVAAPTVTLRLRGNPSALLLAQMVLTCVAGGVNQQLDAQFGFVGVGALTGNTSSSGGFGLAATPAHPDLVTAGGFDPLADKIQLTAQCSALGDFFVGRTALFEVMYAAA